MTNIAGDHVDRARFQCTLQDFVVVGVARDPEFSLRCDHDRGAANRSDRLPDKLRVQAEARAQENFFVFGEQSFGHTKLDLAGKRQFEDEGLPAIRSEVGGNDDVRIQDNSMRRHGDVRGGRA